MSGQATKFLENREFWDDLAQRLRNMAPGKLRSVSSIRNPFRRHDCGKAVKVIAVFEIAGLGNLVKLETFEEVIFNELEAHYCFLLLVAHILIYNQGVLPIRFDIVFDKRRYTKEHLEHRISNNDRPLPDKAPELYPGKWHTDEELPDYFRRVWKDYLSSGLTMSHIRRLDKSLYLAMQNYRRTNPWPDDLSLPNRETALREAIALYEEHGLKALSPTQLVAVAQYLKREGERPGEKPRRGPPRKVAGGGRPQMPTL